MTDPNAEDLKLLTLARAARARLNSSQAAAVRDLDGRTYTATAVDLPSLQLSALQVAVAMALSSGASGLEAAVTIGAADHAADALHADPAGVAAVAEVSSSASVFTDRDGGLTALPTG